jgi:hypothetical protein
MVVSGAFFVIFLIEARVNIHSAIRKCISAEGSPGKPSED